MERNTLVSPESIQAKRLGILSEIVELKKYIRGLHSSGASDNNPDEQVTILAEIERKTIELKKIESEAIELKVANPKHYKTSKKSQKPGIAQKPGITPPIETPPIVEEQKELLAVEDEDQFLNCQQIAKALKITEATVLDWVKKQFLPAVMISEYRYMFTKEDVKFFLENTTSRMFDRLLTIDLTEIEGLLGEKLILTNLSRTCVAKMLGVHRYSVFRWVEKGWLKGNEISNLISKADLRDFIYSDRGIEYWGKAYEAGIIEILPPVPD